ncbi:NeuD/PglB/VioB family sugar acetyltransferase [Sphingomonas sp. IC-56]|uniref:NeuD/PglB/VioB family sugar acetyltransferase n=1 Tax=Sphingomonas sp. IC-56 TaxID=2898529 RepID=UPI001E326551|nr:NeuD/PglB/VioB family sugar acetyltransferase [Sphingomonas sp. IC-56]MCD2323296.1 NeuD/PglB/VioB family sugar acetyltransferase [Sphingomonas sp. IC-56]
MTPFVIFGAGGFARELLGWIAGCGPETRARFQVAAWISEGDDVGSVLHGIPVVTPDTWEGPAPRFVIAVADPATKKRVAIAMAARGWQAETFIHDTAAVGLAPRIGAGTIICPQCRISTDCEIGEHVLVNSSSGIGHDAVVGSYSSLLGAVSVNGNVKLGEGVLMGAGSMVYPGKKVGDWAKIGLGSVVLRSVAANATMFGNPARRIDPS